MKRSNQIISVALATVSLFTLPGCQREKDAAYVEGEQRIVNVDMINDQDWENAASTMVQQILPKLQSLYKSNDKKMYRLRVGYIRNETHSDINVANLKARMEGDLLNTNMLTIAESGGDYYLEGRIIENKTQAGKIKQSGFLFNISMHDAATNDKIGSWILNVTKQGSRPVVGY